MSRKESKLNSRKAIAVIIIVIVLLVSGSVFIFMSRKPIPGTGLDTATVQGIPVAITLSRSLVIMEDGTLVELGKDEGHSHLKVMAGQSLTKFE